MTPITRRVNAGRPSKTTAPVPSLTAPFGTHVPNAKVNIPQTDVCGNITQSPPQAPIIKPSYQPQQKSIPTPIVTGELDTLLSGYDRAKRAFISDGFSCGFRINYQGPMEFRLSNNHKSARDNPEALRKKLQEELRNNRIAGPFGSAPFHNFQASPTNT